jgi:glycosyltransferase XagB
VLETFIYLVVVLISLALVGQAMFTVGLMLYTWARPERLEESASPKEHLPPRLSFTAILPARHEEGVIGDTLRQLWKTSYPKDLLEVVVVCEESDEGTIEEAEEAATEIGHPGVRVVSFAAGDRPVNKPRGLNVALGETENEVVTIFDAEDDIHPEIFDVMNTTMQVKNASIVQAGVQLMDHGSSWYSLQNVLEYFFYFKSRLHYHARVGMIPLGGNTVFIKRDLLEDIGGWDEACLTEDADVGIRLSALGEKIFVTYDAEHATREETPDSIGGFIKQRTRWCQGFFQVFRKGDWKKLPTRGQRLLALYTLTYPYVQAFVGALWIPAVLMMLYLEVPAGLAILSLLPLYAIGFQFFVNLVGLFDFARAYGKRVGALDLVRFTLGFLPYQFLLSISALRAVLREARGATNWEKTLHSGAHRTKKPVPPIGAGARKGR